MAIQRTHQNSFSRGEIDETVIGRTDLDAFEQALINFNIEPKLVINEITHPTGVKKT